MRQRSHTYSTPLQPLLLDNVPESAISICSGFSNPSLASSNTLLFINLPQDPNLTNASNFYKILSQFGSVLSIRVIICSSPQSPAIVLDRVVVAQFGALESAVLCKANLNNYELAPGYSCKVAFASILSLGPRLVPTSSGAISQHPNQALQHQLLQQIQQQHHQQHQQQHQHQHQPQPQSQSQPTSSNQIKFPVEPMDIPKFNQILCKLNSNSSSKLLDSNKCTTLISPPALPSSNLNFTRDLRKQLDKELPQAEIDSIILSLYNDLPTLSCDYLGNTIIQKFLTCCSPLVHTIMVRCLAPYLPQMGTHKNGTWAAQKLINTINNNLEEFYVKSGLEKYIAFLLCDTFGNYVVQGIDKMDTWIWKAILNDFLNICSNRFGARALRTLLESNKNKNKNANSELIKNEIFSAILYYIYELLVDTNGSIMINWIVDSFDNNKKSKLIIDALLSDESKFFKVCQSKVGSSCLIKLTTIIGTEWINEKLMEGILWSKENGNSIGAGWINRCLDDRLKKIIRNVWKENSNLTRLGEECGIQISPTMTGNAMANNGSLASVLNLSDSISKLDIRNDYVENLNSPFLKARERGTSIGSNYLDLNVNTNANAHLVSNQNNFTPQQQQPFPNVFDRGRALSNASLAGSGFLDVSISRERGTSVGSSFLDNSGLSATNSALASVSASASASASVSASASASGGKVDFFPTCSMAVPSITIDDGFSHFLPNIPPLSTTSFPNIINDAIITKATGTNTGSTISSSHNINTAITTPTTYNTNNNNNNNNNNENENENENTNDNDTYDDNKFDTSGISKSNVNGNVNNITAGKINLGLNTLYEQPLPVDLTPFPDMGKSMASVWQQRPRAGSEGNGFEDRFRSSSMGF
ncbi:Puf2 protein [Martiniozyma asiatica (nom. inval.)]|nr:Puf2 protein [Martiniozyma asiatica]